MTVTEADPPVRAIHRIDRIVIGERGNRDVTGLDELKASITGLGLVHPLILTPDRHLVLGARRLQACTELGWTDVPAMTVTGIWQALDYLECEHADLRCLQPLTVHEAMGMDFALRELQWWPKAPYLTGDRNPNLGNERRKYIGELLGMNASQYVRARELWAAARGYRHVNGGRTPITREAQDHAAALMAAITGPADVSPAYRAYCGGTARDRHREGRAVTPVPSVRSTRGDGRRSPQRPQSDQIEHGLASMTGTVAALMTVRVIDPAIPGVQIDDWADDITDLIRDLSTLRRRFTKGQR